MTTWNWAYLADFAPFKPVYLPEDDSSQFLLYFDSSQRRSCYVAPERFLVSDEAMKKEGQLSAQMDIFSLGCVIAELFMDGSPTFTLAQLFKYKKGEFEPQLNGIESEHVTALIRSMISLDPEKRLSAEEYIEQQRGKTFPEYFYFLYDWVSRLDGRENDFMRSSNSPERSIQLETERRIEQIWDAYGELAKNLGYVDELSAPPREHSPKQTESSEAEKQLDSLYSLDEAGDKVVPVCLDMPGIHHWVPRHQKPTHVDDDDDSGLILLGIICSSLRSTLRSETKAKACDLLLAFGERVHDEAKLDRCLPFLMSLLDDASDNVQVAALRSLTHLLTLVNVLTPLHTSIFPEYIFPKLGQLQGRSPIVLTAYAACLPVLARTASKFLDMSQVLRTTGILAEQDPETENGYGPGEEAYDALKQDLTTVVVMHATFLMTSEYPEVKRSILQNISHLSIFLGRQKTNDVILSHAITYLNDKDPFLKMDLFDTIVAIAPYIGVVSLEHYVTPLMIQSLADPQEAVVEKVLHTFATMVEMGLTRENRLWELLKVSAKFLIHPNTWIRNSTVRLLSKSTRWLSPAQLYCIFSPIIVPFLNCELNDFSEASILANLKPQIPQPVYNGAITWARVARKSLFWRLDDESSRNQGYSNSDVSPRSRNVTKPRQVRSVEDENWITRLKDVGLKEENLWMLAVYREYLYRVARSLQQQEEQQRALGSGSQMDNSVEVRLNGTAPHNVFFERSVASRPSSRVANKDTQTTQSQSPPIGGGEVQPTTSSSTHVEPTRFLANGLPALQATPVIGTNLEEVYGEMNSSRPGIHAEADASNSRYTSYEGDDPYIIKMLNAVSFDKTVPDYSEFGSSCIPISIAARSQLTKGGSAKKRRSKPSGTLVASFDEHTGAVNALAVSPDHQFFVSGSDDGTVKIWDTFRLEKNVVNRAIFTYRCNDAELEEIGAQPPVKVKCLCFVHNTYTVAIGLSTGVVRFLKIELAKSAVGPRYKKLSCIRQVDLCTHQGEHPVEMQCIKASGRLYLYAITTAARIVVLDLAEYTSSIMVNPARHGLLTSMVMDRKHNWLVVGTNLGVLDMWDLRFQLHIRTIRLPGGHPITSLGLHPRSSGKWICVAGGTHPSEVTVWDVESFQCKEIYRQTSTGSIPFPENYKPLNDDQLLSSMLVQDLANTEPSVNCLSAGVDIVDAGETSGKRAFLFTGSSDFAVRFWDMHASESSVIVSGLTPETGKPAYGIIYPEPHLKLVYEKTGAAVQKSDKQPRTAVMSSEIADLARNHQSSILQLCLLARPYDMVVSGSRDGVIKVSM